MCSDFCGMICGIGVEAPLLSGNDRTHQLERYVTWSNFRLVFSNHFSRLFSMESRHWMMCIRTCDDILSLRRDCESLQNQPKAADCMLSSHSITGRRLRVVVVSPPSTRAASVCIVSLLMRLRTLRQQQLEDKAEAVDVRSGEDGEIDDATTTFPVPFRWQPYCLLDRHFTSSTAPSLDLSIACLGSQLSRRTRFTAGAAVWQLTAGQSAIHNQSMCD